MNEKRSFSVDWKRSKSSAIIELLYSVEFDQ